MAMPIDRGEADVVASVSSAPGAQPLSADELRRADMAVQAFSEIHAPTPAVTAEGSLAGLSFAVKEVIDQAGRRTAWGTPVLRDRIPTATASVVERVAAAGARCVGTTRSTVLAIAGESLTRNPHDIGRSPGGSSAGSAAAVGAGLLDFAIGTQTVGSVVRPAAYCGVVGFKPTFGHVPSDGVMVLSRHLDHVGFLARNVAVARAVYDVFAPPPASARAAAPVQVMVPDYWFGAVPEDGVARALDRTAGMLSDAGFDVRRIVLPPRAAAEEGIVLSAILARGIHDNHAEFVRGNAASLPGELVELAERGARIDDASLASLLAAQKRIAEELDAHIQDGAVLLAPSVIDLPPLLGSGTGAREPQRLWTLAGWPAINLPVRRETAVGEGLPASVQLIGKAGSDHALLSFAATVESMLPPWEPPRAAGV